MFVDAANLPKNVSDGPESWGEAWSKLGGAGDDVQALIENTTADGAALEAAYDRRIRQIEQLTGQRLANPLRVSSEGMAARDAELVRLQAGQGGIGGAVGGDLMPGYRDAQEADFNSRASALAERYPQVNAVLSTTMEDEKHRVMREAEDMLDRAANSPELGMLGRFSAQLVGGLRGAARDPAQWGMAVFGAPGAAAKTVAGRFGQVMLQEFALNAGQEAFLQAASQERKRAAGLDHGLADAMKNVGIAGTFGALFGGSVQAGAEIARVLNLGEGGAERAARVLDGRPEPGDLEAVAAATGRTIEPDEAATIARSFEERTLDEMMIPNDPTPEDVTLMSAAVRHADDPDNFPAPDIVERALADSADGPSRTLSADDYQRIYDGDPVAVDAYRDHVAAREAGGAVDIADTFDPDPVANMRIRPDEVSEPFDDASMARAERMAGDLPAVPSDRSHRIVAFETAKGSRYEVAGQSTRRNKAARDAPGHEGDFGIKAASSMTIYVDQNAGALSAAGLSGLGSKGARVAIRDGRATLVTWNKKANGWGASEGSRDIPFSLDPGVGKYPLELWNAVDDVPGYQSFSRMHAGNEIVKVEEAAPKSTGRAVDLLPFEDGNGNRMPINIAEALAIADEPTFHADLLEACKL